MALAQRLREHLTFVNLLRVLEGRPKPLSEIVERLRPSLPVASDSEAAGVLNGLCALISVARRLEGDAPSPGAATGNDAGGTADARKPRPFLQVGLHLWVRELRRMVCRLGEPGADEPCRLRYSDDLKADEPSVHLPLIQCRECRVTGWGADFLDAVTNGSASAPGSTEASGSESPRTGELMELQRLLDQRWDTGEIRTSLRASSLELLLRYLAEPVPAKWKQAVFTALIGLFEQRRMQSGEPRMLSPELRSRFDAAVERSLPGQVREAVEELTRHEVADDSQSRVALAGRGVWYGTAPRFADLLLALPLSAVRNGEPDDMAAIVHLHDDETSRAHPRYRPVWNGVLRLYNLLQFLPGAWWTTRTGVERNVYPEYGRTVPSPEISVAPEGWEEAMNLVAPELRPAMEQWSALSLPVPEAGFELTGPAGRVIAEAELAWSERKVAVMLADQQEWTAAFEAEGWGVIYYETDDFSDSVVAALNS